MKSGVSTRNKIVVTRPQPQGYEFSAQLAKAGYDVLDHPFLSIETLAYPAWDAGDYNGLVLSSANALYATGQGTAGFDLPVFAVGEQTAEAARRAGYRKVLSAAGAAEDLAALVVEYGLPAPAKLLFMRGRDIASDLPERLRAAGLFLDERVVYQAVMRSEIGDALRSALKDETVQAITFFSKRTAQAFAAAIRKDAMDSALCGIKALSISPSVLKCVQDFPWACTYAAHTPDRAGMIELIERHCAC